MYKYWRFKKETLSRPGGTVNHQHILHSDQGSQGQRPNEEQCIERQQNDLHPTKLNT